MEVIDHSGFAEFELNRRETTDLLYCSDNFHILISLVITHETHEFRPCESTP